MKTVWVVARHEFVSTVRRVWFLIATFVFPVLMLGIGGGMMLLGKEVAEESLETLRSKPLGMVDLWGGLKTDPPFPVRRFDGEERAREALLEHRIEVYTVVPDDYLEKGRIRVVTRRRPTLMTMDRGWLPPEFDPWLVENVLAEVDAARVQRAKAPSFRTTVHLDAMGAPSAESAMATAKRSVLAYAFFMLLFVSIFTASGYLLYGMAEEKENRVMEMVLTSITPGRLMLGKLLGLGAVGLLQLAVWVVMGIAGAAALAVGIVLEPGMLVFCLVFFLLGYVFYGSLMLGFGALGSNFRESQQMASVWSLLGISPFFIVMAIFEQPQGTLAQTFSFIPFTAPTTMIFRYAIDPEGTPLWEILLAAGVLLVATLLALKISARLFRAGLLLYGKRPGIREILRWLVASKS
jgi:ABC-2 type transport system permease protein